MLASRHCRGSASRYAQVSYSASQLSKKACITAAAPPVDVKIINREISSVKFSREYSANRGPSCSDVVGDADSGGARRVPVGEGDVIPHFIAGAQIVSHIV